MVKDPPADLQSVWHDFVGNKFHEKNILDVGAGQGRSKERLSKNGNIVTTQDINRNLMLDVDLIVELRNIRRRWDVVTAFDVIEHVVDPLDFLLEIQLLSKTAVFITTPNRKKFNTPWHYTYFELKKMIDKFQGQIIYVEWFKRTLQDGKWVVEEWNETNDEEIPYFGICIYWRNQ